MLYEGQVVAKYKVVRLLWSLQQKNKLCEVSLSLWSLVSMIVVELSYRCGQCLQSHVS